MPQDAEYAKGGTLEVRVARDGDTATLVLVGEFDLATLRAARAGLEEARRNGARRIVVDLRDLTFIDSTGIAFLIAARRDDPDDRLSFIPSESLAVRRVLGITGVDELFGGTGGVDPSPTA
jgi:anti-anti-sigma factor